MPTFYGTNSNDVLTTGYDNDTVFALDGDDAVFGEYGNDELHGGLGNDFLNGGEGNNTLYGEEGDDSLFGGTGDSYGHLYGGDGNDVLNAAQLGGELHGGAGNDILNGSLTFGTLLAGDDGDDSITGGDGYDTLDGGAGIDTLSGGLSSDIYVVDNALDVITGETSAQNQYERDTLVLASDSLAGTAFTTLPTYFEVLDASALTVGVTLTGNGGEAGSGYRNTLKGGAGNDTLIGTGANDYLDGNGGGDQFTGGDGNDTYVFDSVLDSIAPEFAWDISHTNPGAYDIIILSGSGFDGATVLMPDNIETLTAISSTGWTPNATGNLHLVGNDNTFSSIIDGSGNGWLEGRGGIDLLHGNAGDDTLDGGAGAAMLVGGEGNDLYIVRYENTLIGDPTASSLELPYFNDLYENGTDGPGLVDTVSFVGIDYAQVRLGLRGDDLLVLTPEDHVVLRVQGYFQDGNRIEQFLFNGVTDPTAEGDLAALQALHDGGPSTAETDGSDVITLSTGAVVLAAGGHDIVNGSADADSIEGGTGNDSLLGEAGNDTLLGGNGDDSLEGGDGDDLLAGGAGSDLLSGYTGGDTYRFGLGDGVDFIIDQDASNSGIDVLELTGLNAGDVTFTLIDQRLPLLVNWMSSLRISVNGTDDRIDVLGQFQSPDPSTGIPGDAQLYRIEEIHFADGTVWDAADILGAATSTGNLATGGDDSLTGTTGDDRSFPANDPSNPNRSIDGLAGNDDIRMLAGNDMAYGGAGNDSVYGNTGDDMLFGGDGNDVVNGGNDNDTLFGGAGDDEVRGGNGNDMLIGVEVILPPATPGFTGTGGNDSLYGGAGDDLYLVVDATTSVHEGAGNGTDTVWANIASYTLSANVENLYVADLDGVPTDIGQFLALAGAPQAVTLIGNALGNTLVGNALGNSVYGGGGDDIVHGQDGNDTLDGANGNDVLNGGLGADSLSGAANNDTLDGGQGNDTLLGGTGDDSLWGDEGNDSLSGGDGNDTLEGTAGWDTLLGGIGNDSLLGGHGSDTLRGGDGNDTLFGGVENDRLVGEAGADVFAFRNPFADGGIDTIVDFAGDVIQVDAALTDLGYTGVLDAANFHVGSAATDVAHRFVYDAGNGRLYYDADGSGGTAQVQFATITGAPALAATDIVLA